MAAGRKGRIAAALAAALLLTACGGTPLSQREVVRAVFFGEGRALLLLADADAPEGKTAYKTAEGRGATPAQALQDAAGQLDGTAFYGLMDVVGLPAGCGWEAAAGIGALLYREGKPAPELSVFLLQGDETAQNAGEIYESLQALEKSHGVHCGLQTLFAQEGLCALPARAGAGYGFALLPKGGEPALFTRPPAAQLAAVLCGQADKFSFTFAGGAARCRADAEATVLPQTDATRVQLHLQHLELDVLAEPMTEDSAAAALRGELLAAFAALRQTAQAQNSDPMHLRFWTAVQYGPAAAPAPPQLAILLE